MHPFMCSNIDIFAKNLPKLNIFVNTMYYYLSILYCYVLIIPSS